MIVIINILFYNNFSLLKTLVKRSACIRVSFPGYLSACIHMSFPLPICLYPCLFLIIYLLVSMCLFCYLSACIHMSFPLSICLYPCLFLVIYLLVSVYLFLVIYMLVSMCFFPSYLSIIRCPHNEHHSFPQLHSE